MNDHETGEFSMEISSSQQSRGHLKPQAIAQMSVRSRCLQTTQNGRFPKRFEGMGSDARCVFASIEELWFVCGICARWAACCGWGSGALGSSTCR